MMTLGCGRGEEKKSAVFVVWCIMNGTVRGGRLRLIVWLHGIPWEILVVLKPEAFTCLFDGHMIYDSHVFTSILSISNMCPPMVQPIMIPCTMWSGTFYSFALDEPYAHFLVYHSYLTCLYFTFHSDHDQRRASQLPIQVSPRIKI